MLKREWGVESNRKLPHLSTPSKTAAWVPEFAVEDLPLGRTASLVPEFAVKYVPLGITLLDDDDVDDDDCILKLSICNERYGNTVHAKTCHSIPIVPCL